MVVGAADKGIDSSCAYQILTSYVKVGPWPLMSRPSPFACPGCAHRLAFIGPLDRDLACGGCGLVATFTVGRTALCLLSTLRGSYAADLGPYTAA